jgi:hypothetical protein
VTGQQRMLTPPWHLILPSHLSEVRVALHSICICPLDYDYILHIVNFAILYCKTTSNITAFDLIASHILGTMDTFGNCSVTYQRMTNLLKEKVHFTLNPCSSYFFLTLLPPPEPVRIRVIIGLPYHLVSRKRRLNGGDPSDETRKTKDPCLSKGGTIKIPLCSKVLSAEHRPKFCTPSPVMVTSPYQ